MAHIVIEKYEGHMKEIPIHKYRNGDEESYKFLAQKMTEICEQAPFGSFKRVEYRKDEYGESIFAIICNNDYEYIARIHGDSNIAAIEDLLKVMLRHC